MKNSFTSGLSFLRQPGSFSMAGICKYISLRLRRKVIMVTGSCLGCGACCRSICLEGPDGWLRSERTFSRLVKKYPEYERFDPAGTDAQGFLLFRCSWCTAQGTCRDYDNRLPLCANFPESTLLFIGGRLPENCGYRFTEVVPFARILRQEMSGKK